MNFNYYLFKLLDKLLLIVGAAGLRPELLLRQVVAPLLLLLLVREVCPVLLRKGLDGDHRRGTGLVLLLRPLLRLLRLTLPVVLQLGLDVLRMLPSKPRHRLLVGLAGTDDNRGFFVVFFFVGISFILMPCGTSISASARLSISGNLRCSRGLSACHTATS